MIDLKIATTTQAIPAPAPGRIMLHVDVDGDLAIKASGGAVSKLAREGPAPAAVPVVVSLNAAATANGTASVVHGVAAAKVAGASAACLLASGAIALPGDATAANLYTVTVGATTVTVKNGAGATAIYSRPVKVVMWVTP